LVSAGKGVATEQVILRIDRVFCDDPLGDEVRDDPLGDEVHFVQKKSRCFPACFLACFPAWSHWLGVPLCSGMRCPVERRPLDHPPTKL
jgi:hypothetical protein